MSAPSIVRRADVGEQTYLGVVDKLSDLFGPRSRLGGEGGIPVLPVPNVDNVEAALQAKSQQLSFPTIAVGPGSFEPDTQSYNPSVLRKFGFPASISRDRSTWTILSLTPVLVTYTVLMITNDWLTMLRMADRWMANELWSFGLRQDDYCIRIQVQADKALTLPQQQPGPGGADQFRQQTTLRVKTYAGYLWQVPSVYFTEFDLRTADNFRGRLQDIQNQDEEVGDLVLSRIDSPSTHEPVV